MTRPRMRPCVLLVEDYQDAREMYADYLTFSGFDVIQAEDGLQAIDQALAHGPDIILMDLALPKLDGWEATRRLKEHPKTRRVPIVALTGHALAGHEDSALQAGCDSFVTKPCLPDQLVAEIRRMLAANGAGAVTPASTPRGRATVRAGSTSRPAKRRRAARRPR